jgi:hypothetical protein
MMNLYMVPVPLERLSPYLSSESKNAQVDVVCDLGISFNMDSSRRSWTLDIKIVSAILVESDFSLMYQQLQCKVYLVLF